METFTTAFGLICLISFLISALGFIYLIYFFSLGYAFSIAGMALMTMILFWGNMGIWVKAFCALLVVYGLRLGIYLLVRELRSASYRRILRPETDANANKRSPGFKVILWVMFSGARRLELRQNKNYGDRPEYQEYIAKVPIILPLIPLYSVARHKWLMA